MRGRRSRVADGHRGLATPVVVGLLVLSGLVSIGVALGVGPGSGPSSSPDAATSPTAAGTPSASATDLPETTDAGPLVLPASRPVRLSIPAIGVRARLLRLGLTPAGELEVPPDGPDYDRPGWYRYSPTPGALGPAVIVGHVASAADGPSVFARLSTLRKRDLVRVTRADGSVAVFRVDRVGRFAKAEFPTDLVYGNTDHAALRLITCGGAIGGDGHYVDNIVVLASLVDPAV
jgi:hypothetical protein